MAGEKNEKKGGLGAKRSYIVPRSIPSTKDYTVEPYTLSLTHTLFLDISHINFSLIFQIKSATLRDLDELANGRDTVNKNVDDIRTSRGNGLVGRHGDGDALRGGTSLETSGVKEGHAVTHVERVSDKSTVVERDLDGLCVGGSGELDVESGSNLERLAGELDVGGTGGVALEIRGSVDLVAELGDEWVLGVGLEYGLLDGVGAGDE